MSPNRRIARGILFTVALALLVPTWTMHGQSAAIPLRRGDPLPDITGQSLSGNSADLSTAVEGKKRDGHLFLQQGRRQRHPALGQ